jgi:hypothetical protein
VEKRAGAKRSWDIAISSAARRWKSNKAMLWV